MQPDFKKEAQRWLAQAERDLDDANFTKDGKRFNLACFLYQQAAEKAIKAYLYTQEIEDIWGHSVAELCGEAERYNKVFSSLLAESASLDKYYIPTRYPNGLPGGIPADVFQQKDADDASSSCQKIIAAVKTLI